MSVWPVPHEPRPTPWQPEPRPPSPLPSAPSQWHLVDSHVDWLDERLLGQRVVSLAGPLDADTANRAAASLALLDASGDDLVKLRLCDVDADLDTALTLVDTLDLMGVPVHATCLGKITGLALAILAVADHRTAARHATLHLREPRTQWSGHATDVTVHAEHHQRQLRFLQERIAQSCRRPTDAVAADMRTGRILTAEEAQGYGLVDTVVGPRTIRRP
ncbi:MAG: ATP-dependent Clp protease proteolytic subunit [Actinomycetota bacterium]|nr:ATP-dependent Clp protease proteolytic subunit [Actinomycetota bacterium]